MGLGFSYRKFDPATSATDPMCDGVFTPVAGERWVGNQRSPRADRPRPGCLSSPRGEPEHVRGKKWWKLHTEYRDAQPRQTTSREGGGTAAPSASSAHYSHFSPFPPPRLLKFRSTKYPKTRLSQITCTGKKKKTHRI